MYLGTNADMVEIEQIFFDVFSFYSRENRQTSETIGGGF